MGNTKIIFFFLYISSIFLFVSCENEKIDQENFQELENKGSGSNTLNSTRDRIRQRFEISTRRLTKVSNSINLEVPSIVPESLGLLENGEATFFFLSESAMNAYYELCDESWDEAVDIWS